MSGVRFELTTYGFSVHRSAAELPKLIKKKKRNYIIAKINKVIKIKNINQQNIKCFQLYWDIWSIRYLGKVPRIPMATKQIMNTFMTKYI